MKNHEQGAPLIDEKYQIHITQNGPYMVFGNAEIRQQTIVQDDDGSSWEYRAGEKNYVKLGAESVALCRCGHTKNAPYCDGSHLKAKWDPALTAQHRPPLVDAQQFVGQTLTLTDNPKYCAYARFCEAKDDVWNLTRSSDDRQNRDWAIHASSRCPSGRLKEWDNASQEALEPCFEPSIALIEDPVINRHGPIWVRGGIPVTAADGYVFQVRNRVTLCRCGRSGNKPFCDGSHAR
ncbi:MAG: CDGSH iron-sulfur domain-containing protein [Mucinivorans sp.]